MRLSLEFFPPKNQQMEDSLWEVIKEFAVVKPEFVSVTYGAGGTTRDKTYDTVIKILKETNLSPASHLTCIGDSREEINDLARKYWQDGIRHIVALRGDLPENYEPKKDSYHYAWQLVQELKKIHDFEISVAGYPEKHPEAKNMEADLDNLKRKIDAGASRIITQFCFKNEQYLEYMNLLEQKQIKVTMVPGILPITNFQQMAKFAKRCGALIPEEIEQRFSNSNEEQSFAIARDVASEQCSFLMEHGVKEFHFYTLNKSCLTLAILRQLGVIS